MPPDHYLSALSAEFSELQLQGDGNQTSASFEGLPSELLLKILKQVDIKSYFKLSHSSPVIRSFLKSNGRELCNNIAEMKLKEANAADLFTVQQKLGQEWMRPDAELITSTAFLNQGKGVIDKVQVESQIRTLYEAMNAIDWDYLVDREGPQFAYLQESQAYHIKYYGRRVHKLRIEMQDLITTLKNEDKSGSYDREHQLNHRRYENLVEDLTKMDIWFREYILHPVLLKLCCTKPRLKECVWYLGAPVDDDEKLDLKLDICLFLTIVAKERKGIRDNFRQQEDEEELRLMMMLME